MIIINIIHFLITGVIIIFPFLKNRKYNKIKLFFHLLFIPIVWIHWILKFDNCFILMLDNYFSNELNDRNPLFNKEGLAPAGRLDIDSTGLLILTQDGTMAKKIIGENVVVEKEYLVKVQGNLTDENLRLLNHGLTLDGYKLKPAKVSWQNEDQLKFVLIEGRNRQIRKMCAMVNLKVTSLKRVRIGDIKLGNLPLGQWRFLKK